MTLGLLLVFLTSCSCLGFVVYRPETVPPFNGNKTVYVVKENQVIEKQHDGWVLISKGFLQELYRKARYFRDIEDGEGPESEETNPEGTVDNE